MGAQSIRAHFTKRVRTDHIHSIHGTFTPCMESGRGRLISHHCPRAHAALYSALNYFTALKQLHRILCKPVETYVSHVYIYVYMDLFVN